MLTNKIIDGAKPKERQYKLADAKGLYLVVTPANSKIWRCDYKQGTRKTHTFGKYPDISLAKARQLNVEFKDYLANGFSAIPTFDEVKRKWYLAKLPEYKNTKHKQQIIYRLDELVSPKIGNMRIDAIRRVNLVELVQEVQQRKKNGLNTVETAHRVAMHMRQVFDYAVDLGFIDSHPATNLSRVLNVPKTSNMACVSVADSGKLLRDIYEFESVVTRLGLCLVAHTFVRTSEVRYMQWSEIKDKRFWVIPAERMKMKKPHVVPLSDAVLGLLAELRNINGSYQYVLNSPFKPNKPISENTMLDGLYSLGYRHKMTVHGFRALASTVLNEQSPFSHDVIERQLAHKETDAVRAAYNRAEYLDERIKLMGWWSDWILQAMTAK